MESKLLDDEISKGDMKMRAALDSYLSVSESDNEEESKQNKECSDQKLVSKTTGKKTRNQTDKKSSSSGKQMAAAMYSGLISHSDTSGDEGIKLKEEHRERREEEVSDDDEDDDDIIGEAGDKGMGEDEDPDFMASDDLPDEYTSVNDNSNRKQKRDETPHDYEEGELFRSSFLNAKDKGSHLLITSDDKSYVDDGEIEDGEAIELTDKGRITNRKKSTDEVDCEHRSAFSSVRGKNHHEGDEQKQESMVFDYE